MNWIEFLAAMGAGAVLTLIVEVVLFFWATRDMNDQGEKKQ